MACTRRPRRVGQPYRWVGRILFVSWYAKDDDKMTKRDPPRRGRLADRFIVYESCLLQRNKIKKLLGVDENPGENYVTVAYIYTNMADEFATPISKLGQISTRDSDGEKPSAALSYEDILRSQDQPPPPEQGQMPPQQPTFQEPVQQFSGGPQERLQDMYTPQMGGDTLGGDMTPYPQQQQQYQPDMFSRQPIPSAPTMPTVPPLDYQSPPSPAPVEPSTDQKEPQKWWKTWILYNKVGIISAVVIFALIAFVLPRVSAMPRFSMVPGGLPRYVLGIISVAGGSMISAAHMSI
jgi:hypothetical protein